MSFHLDWLHTIILLAAAAAIHKKKIQLMCNFLLLLLFLPNIILIFIIIFVVYVHTCEDVHFSHTYARVSEWTLRKPKENCFLQPLSLIFFFFFFFLLHPPLKAAISSARSLSLSLSQLKYPLENHAEHMKTSHV